MTYAEAMDWIMGFWGEARPRDEERALRPQKVPRMRALLERLGRPHTRYPSVLVAGTKGKGSTAAFIAEGLRSAGYRVGRYTQPHLIDWRERTWVDGSIIRPDEVVDVVHRIRPTVEGLHASGEMGGITTYEAGTAMTLTYFAQREVDIAVLEVGVGGRLDALNAVDPALSVITAISLDHTDVLGNTLSEIATEKAGIFRPGLAVVVGPQQPEAEEAIRRAGESLGTFLYMVGRGAPDPEPPAGSNWAPRGATNDEEGPHSVAPRGRRAHVGDEPRRYRDAFPGPAAGEGPGASVHWLWRPGGDPATIDVAGPLGELMGLELALLGDHQRDNATVAVAALQLLGEHGFCVDSDAIRRGLAGVEWPGRAQLLHQRPAVLVDAAHNADSSKRLMETVRSHFRYGRLILVFGASAEKDIAGMAGVLGPPAARVVVTSSGHRRAANLVALASAFAPYSQVETEPDSAAAIRFAVSQAAPEDLVLVTGSVFLAGQAIQVMSNE